MSKRRRETEGIEKSSKANENTGIDEKRVKGPTDVGDLKVHHIIKDISGNFIPATYTGYMIKCFI